MYCKNCAKEIDDKALICPHCGVPQAADNGGFGWGVLGCCIPLVGLILFLVWKDTKPKSSKSAGIGALIGFGSCILLYVLMIFLGVLGAAAGM